MADLNVCTVVGRLTDDAQLQQVGAKGTTLVKFTLANNTGFGAYAKTNFFRVEVWGKQAEGVYPYLKKGKTVGVTGQLEQKSWVDEFGTKKELWSMNAASLCLMSANGSDMQNSIPSTAYATQNTAQAETLKPGEELPF